MRLACTAALLSSGCLWNEPPSYFSIDQTLKDSHAVVVEKAISDWCSVSGHCPERALWSERGRIIVDQSVTRKNVSCDEGFECERVGRNYGDNIFIAFDPSWISHTLWVVIAHEWGHYCIDDHLPKGLMTREVLADNLPAAIDDSAASAWRKGCGL